MTARTAYDDFETIVCSCGISFHGYVNAMAKHEIKRHCAGDQLTYAVFTAGDQELDLIINRTAA